MAEYYGYCRVSSYKQGKRNTIAEQIKPVSNYLVRHGVSKSQLRNHIYRDTYTGMTMNRPYFNKLVHQLRPGDIVVCYRLDRLSRDGFNAMSFIRKHPYITFHILQPSMDLSADDKASSKFIHDMMILFSQFDHDIVMARFNDGKARIKAEIKAGKIKPYNYNGGMLKRFYGKKKTYYKSVYNYATDHSEREAGRVFGCSTRTVQRIKRSGRQYYARIEAKKMKQNPNQIELIKKNKLQSGNADKAHKKPIKISKKLHQKLVLQDKLQSERDDLIVNSQDLSLLKLSNPPLYRRKYVQQRKAKANIRKAIKHTKKELKKFN